MLTLLTAPHLLRLVWPGLKSLAAKLACQIRPEPSTSAKQLLVIDLRPSADGRLTEEVLCREMAWAKLSVQVLYRPQGTSENDFRPAPECILVLGWRLTSPLSLLQLREKCPDAWILVLGTGTDAPAATEDFIAALTLGADTYVEESMGLRCLLAYACHFLAMGRPGAAGEKAEEECIRLDQRSRRLVVNGHQVRLSRAQFSVLQKLMAHPYETVSPETLSMHLGQGEDARPQSNALAVCIYRLRKALSRVGADQCIEAEPCFGYRFNPDRLEELP